MIENFDKPKNKLVDVLSSYSESKQDVKERIDLLVRSFLKNYLHDDVEEIAFTCSSDEDNKSE